MAIKSKATVHVYDLIQKHKSVLKRLSWPKSFPLYKRISASHKTKQFSLSADPETAVIFNSKTIT